MIRGTESPLEWISLEVTPPTRGAGVMSGSLEVAEVFRRHGPAWRVERGEHPDRAQRRVMGAIEAWRPRRSAAIVTAASTAAMR